MIITRLVEFSRRRAGVVAAAALVLALGAGFYVAGHASIDSDTSKLIDPNLPWQKASDDVDRQFPQDNDLLVAVIDGATPEQAADAATGLADALAQQKSLFSYVRDPEANPYLRRNGLLLLLSPAEVQDFCDHLISAQPFLGTIAADPSVRGVLGAIDLLAQGALRHEVASAQIDGPLKILADAAEAAAEGRRQPLSWQQFFSGRKPDPGDFRRFVLASTTHNYGEVQSASDAIDAVRKAARDAGLTPENGVTVRVTGQVALDNDQLSALSEGATFSAVLCLGLLGFWLVVGLRELRTVLAVVVTLLVGLVTCAAFAVWAVGPFNPVSIAFAPLFIGIAIDFSIQFSIRYEAERLTGTPIEASRRTALGIGTPLAVAAVATAVGFISFAPTAYLGVRSLGLIAGAGMIIALLLNLTLLPALLSLLRIEADSHAAGFAWGGVVDRFIPRRRRWVVAGIAVLSLIFATALPRLRFDFNPVDLENSHSESVSTLLDLTSDVNTCPYYIEFLDTSAAAMRTADRLQQLPEVDHVLSANSFIPGDQAPKLEALEDAASLLGPTLSPAVVKPAPSPGEALAAIVHCADDMAQLGAQGDAPAARLAVALRKIIQGGAAAVPALSTNFSAGISLRLDDLRQVLQAGPVSLDTLPPDFRRDWIAPDGRWRVEVYPKGDVRDNETLRHFARTVQSVVPQAVGSAIAVEEWSRLAPRAFAMAGLLALGAISILLLVVLRNVYDVVLVFAPLLLAGLFTLGAAALLGLSINFANIITLPMMLGIGVAFDIYFVMRHRSGEPDLLGSSTAYGVIFSALTTGTAFGSLALSKSPGMAEMGKFLSLSLFFILFCTLFVLPAFFGVNPAREITKKEKTE
ncbi:MAG TPA: MMPL family transporter [Opitutaceae bacterium]|nr:MMPL family transporter [Opitutaceae bacterium]